MWAGLSRGWGFIGLFWGVLAPTGGQAQMLDGGALVGVRSAQVEVPERRQTIDLTHWYPATAGGVAEQVGANAVFVGTPAQRNAPVATGSFPLVVLSHGGLRAARYMGAWLAADLARRGYWVVQVHAPVLKPTDAAKALRETWLRPADLSAAVTATNKDPLLRRHIMGSAVGVVGLYRGGTSALMLTGGRLDPLRHARMCDGSADVTGPDCTWFREQGVALGEVDNGALGQSRVDSRIQVAVVVAPELGQIFTDSSLTGMGVPVHLLSLGQGEEVPAYLDTSRLAQAISGATHQVLPQANAFSAFAVCTEKGAGLLRDEGEDPDLCAEAGGQSRHGVHDEIGRLIDAALRTSLGAARK